MTYATRIKMMSDDLVMMEVALLVWCGCCDVLQCRDREDR